MKLSRGFGVCIYTHLVTVEADEKHTDYAEDEWWLVEKSGYTIGS